MSTSLAALPAYKATKATRTKARTNRTIFGTTLDSYGKLSKLLNDEKAQSEAQKLYERRYKKWKSPTPRTSFLQNNAWGLTDFKQPQIGEQYCRSYSRLSSYSAASSCSLDLESVTEDKDQENLQRVTEEEQRGKTKTPLLARRNKFGIYNVFTDNLTVGNQIGRAASALSRPSGNYKLNQATDRRRPKTTMSDHDHVKCSKVSNRACEATQKKMKVTKFPIPNGTRNYMRTASLKITETGAKDLINAEPINKIGLGDSLQYNYEWYRRQKTPLVSKPMAYRDHGNVFLLGQKFYGDTTNKDSRGPGGFYNISTDQRASNNRYEDGDGRLSTGTGGKYSMPYNPSITIFRRTHDAARRRKKRQQVMHNSTASTDVEIPANIAHKFGKEEIKRLFDGKEHEIKMAIEKAKHSNLSHTGMVPPRVEVAELNHPIDPPPKYFTNFGQNLKYDKFEGGLHLYIN